MDVLARLRQILEARGWSEYKLAKESGLSESTIANIYKRNTIPSIPTLEAICGGFDITLSQFFAVDVETVELTPELHDLFEEWLTLTPVQKEATLRMMRAFNHEN